MVLGYGAEKYGQRDQWRYGFEQSRLIAAALRHLLQWKDESHADSETGRSHLAHAICELLFALNQELTGTGHDDSWVAVREARRVRLDGVTITPLTEDDETTEPLPIDPITI